MKQNILKSSLKYIGALIFVVMITFSCKEDFLDSPPQGSLDSGTLGNQFGIEASLIATYSLLDGYGQFGGWGGAGSNWIFGGVSSDNAYKGSEPGDQQATSDVELYQWSTGAADEYLQDKWRVVYEGVARANATLALMATVEDLNSDDRSRIEGETKFLRAHYHFEAYKFWKNIPYYTEADADFRKSNDADALPLIIGDLQAAISALPTSQSDVGRITQWTAKAYLGRVQVYTGDYAAGKAILSEVVNSGTYGLEICFHDVFSAADDNGAETVLAYQASSNDGDGGGDNGNRNDRLNFPHGGSPFGCCGFYQPSQNLVNAFKVDAAGLPLLDGSFNDADVVATDAVDPRLDWTVGRDDVPFLDWGLHAPGWIRDRAWAGPYSNKKSVYEQNSGVGSQVGWANYQLHSMNMHLYRYAEVLLLLAEAEVETGNLERGRELVNMIRERAAACAQGPEGTVEVAMDDPGITWATYSVGTYDSPWSDQNAARDAVRMENRLELAMEGHRFFNLRRWGVAQQVLNDYISVEKTKRNYLTGANSYEPRHDLFPLPTVQIELSQVEGADRLTQNPGW